MASDDIALMAHLMRRAGFGASREELEARAARGYEATVEELVNPTAEPVDRHDFYRYHPGFWKPITSPGMGGSAWFHTMLTTKRPLEEKMVLFWHHVFATGQSKIDNWHELINQADMLREKGMGNYRDLLVALAKNPAMIYWLDNCDNHGHAVNENWGRELLELFSLGGYGWASQLHGDRRPGGLGPSPAGPSRARRAATTGGTGNSNTSRKITMMAKRPSWAIRATSTVRTLSTSSCSSRPVTGLSPAICTTSSSPMRHRCRRG